MVKSLGAPTPAKAESQVSCEVPQESFPPVQLMYVAIIQIISVGCFEYHPTPTR